MNLAIDDDSDVLEVDEYRGAALGTCGRSRASRCKLGRQHASRAGRRAQAGRHCRSQRRPDAVGANRRRPAARARHRHRAVIRCIPRRRCRCRPHRNRRAVRSPPRCRRWLRCLIPRLRWRRNRTATRPSRPRFNRRCAAVARRADLAACTRTRAHADRSAPDDDRRRAAAAPNIFPPHEPTRPRRTGARRCRRCSRIRARSPPRKNRRCGRSRWTRTSRRCSPACRWSTIGAADRSERDLGSVKKTGVRKTRSKWQSQGGPRRDHRDRWRRVCRLSDPRDPAEEAGRGRALARDGAREGRHVRRLGRGARRAVADLRPGQRHAREPGGARPGTRDDCVRVR